ncbi:hypothetical protein K2173_007544 [Erythroxylum novogranatense]|uniref:Calcium uniporter protein C-terminal domain-containing protein n=1 Tax=Erythroxylum novogranatense TaxID=1862640 RepID=A0AAV8T6J8_9ROSI|nr:hypothetical protein K2173_007544 [Erythroxylum novogranatense]
MALRRLLGKRLEASYRAASKAVAPEHSPISSVSPSLQVLEPPNSTKTNLHREYLTSPESVKKGLFQRFFHRKAISQLPDILYLPVGEKLRERLRGMNGARDRLHLEGLPSPVPGVLARETNVPGISVEDARKLLKVSQVEKLKAKLREIPKTSISYSEFVEVCGEECGNREQGVELAKTLDQSGNVIVLGNNVFLRPEQMAKSIESVISQSVIAHDDSRQLLEHMEKQKAMIDQKARSLVRGELYCGLGFLVVQTLGFMRLTFWELSWDVMEPVCFFVTSLHFALAYGFFLRTSTEPSFEGYFKRRFIAKQKKLMRLHNFDIEKYNELRKLFNLSPGYGFTFTNPTMHG